MQKFSNRFTGNVHKTADRLVNSNPRDAKLRVSDIFQIVLLFYFRYQIFMVLSMHLE